MPSVRLTVTRVGELPVEASKQIFYYDDQLIGFGVRTSGKNKTYIVRVRCKSLMVDGRRVEIKETLGKVQKDIKHPSNVDKIHFDKMLSRAKQIIDDASKDITPAMRREEARVLRLELERAKKIEEAKDLTLGELFDEYLATKKARGRLKDSTAGQYQETMRSHFSDWLDRPARGITSSEINARHIAIASKGAQTYTTKKGKERQGVRGGKGAADAAMRILRAAFNYGGVLHRDSITFNPVAVLSATGGWCKLERRKGFIATTQLKSWFEAVNGLEHEGIKVLLLMSLFTGARKQEIASLTWNDVDLEANTVTFRDTKNGKVLLVPLAGYMADVLTRYQADHYTGPDGFVFPSFGKSGHLKDPRKAMKKVAEQTGVTTMIHDNRRTFLSYANAVGVPSFTQKRLVNHALPGSGDVTAGYVQFELPGLRAAVELIAKYILDNAGITVTPDADVNIKDTEVSHQEPSNVISFDEHRAKKAA